MSNQSFAERTQRYQLNNGLTLLVLENHTSPAVAMSGYLMAGEYFNPPGKDMLGDLTASMLNKGTERHSKFELADRLESIGARLGFDALTFAASFGGRSLTKDFPTLITTLAEMLRTPRFPAEELDKLKQQYVASIKEYQDDTGARAYERLTQLVFDEGSPFHRYPSERSVRELESITVADVQAFYAQHYGTSTMILAVVGDVVADEVRQLIEDHLGDWQGATAPPILVPVTPVQNAPQRDTVFMKGKQNCNVVIGHASGLRRANPDYYAAVIANRALGQSTLSSRLGLKVRDEMGLTYGINSSFPESGFADGPFIISVTVSPTNIETAITAALEIVHDYQKSGITPVELSDEQSSMIGGFKVGLATNAGIAGQIASAEIFGLGVKHLDEYPNYIRAVTKEQVDAAIGKYFHPTRATTVIAGDYKL
jgi:zinc protease